MFVIRFFYIIHFVFGSWNLLLNLYLNKFIIIIIINDGNDCIFYGDIFKNFYKYPYLF
jgi:hypothetical protein